MPVHTLYLPALPATTCLFCTWDSTTIFTPHTYYIPPSLPATIPTTVTHVLLHFVPLRTTTYCVFSFYTILPGSIPFLLGRSACLHHDSACSPYLLSHFSSSAAPVGYTTFSLSLTRIFLLYLCLPPHTVLHAPGHACIGYLPPTRVYTCLPFYACLLRFYVYLPTPATCTPLHATCQFRTYHLHALTPDLSRLPAPHTPPPPRSLFVLCTYVACPACHRCHIPHRLPPTPVLPRFLSFLHLPFHTIPPTTTPAHGLAGVTLPPTHTATAVPACLHWVLPIPPHVLPWVDVPFLPAHTHCIVYGHLLHALPPCATPLSSRAVLLRLPYHRCWDTPPAHCRHLHAHPALPHRTGFLRFAFPAHTCTCTTACTATVLLDSLVLYFHAFYAYSFCWFILHIFYCRGPMGSAVLIPAVLFTIPAFACRCGSARLRSTTCRLTWCALRFPSVFGSHTFLPFRTRCTGCTLYMLLSLLLPAGSLDSSPSSTYHYIYLPLHRSFILCSPLFCALGHRFFAALRSATTHYTLVYRFIYYCFSTCLYITLFSPACWGSPPCCLGLTAFSPAFSRHCLPFFSPATSHTCLLFLHTFYLPVPHHYT